MPHKLQNILDKILWGAGVITIGLILGIGIQFAIAAIWTGPTSAPPNDNVSSPINTGANQQLKGDFSSHIGSLSLAGVLETFGFKMPTGAQPGYVLTAQDANGQAAWAAGGGGACFTYYCNVDSRAINTSSPRNPCVNSGLSQGYCPSGFSEIYFLGDWGYCTDVDGYSAFRPAGGGCLWPSGGTMGKAFLCCQ